MMKDLGSLHSEEFGAIGAIIKRTADDDIAGNLYVQKNNHDCVHTDTSKQYSVTFEFNDPVALTFFVPANATPNEEELLFKKAQVRYSETNSDDLEINKEWSYISFCTTPKSSYLALLFIVIFYTFGEVMSWITNLLKHRQ
ncbi:hypothetical protein KW800_02735 [Candidatus Parcubacteria bacterium]|nr:hypothetical protein [Candidatus Parcubacteria bacterium]